MVFKKLVIIFQSITLANCVWKKIQIFQPAWKKLKTYILRFMQLSFSYIKIIFIPTNKNLMC